MTTISRRSVLRGAAGLTALSLGGGQTFAQNPASITVCAFGGVWAEAVQKAFVADFRRRTGVDARVLAGLPPAWMGQIEASRAKPPIDSFVCTVDLVLAAAESGIVDKLTTDKVPALAEIPARFTEACEGWGTITNYASVGIAYHKRVKEPPKSVVEFVDGAIKGKWRVSLPGTGFASTPQFLIWPFADALGGSVDNVEPAFDALKKMKPNAVFWNGINDPLQHLQSGEADLAIYPDGRVWAAVDSGADWISFVNPKEGAAMSPACIVKVKNSAEIAWEYVNSCLSAGPQSTFAKIVNYPVTNPKVVYESPLKERILTPDQVRVPPFSKIVKVQRSWMDRWNRELRV